MSANIELKIKNFQPGGGGAVDSIEHEMGDPKGDSNVEPGSAKDRLKVKKGGTNLTFEVIDGNGGKNSYTTITPQFYRLVNGVPSDPMEWTPRPHGEKALTFTSVRCNGNKISFDDNFPESGPAQSYKFWIFVLRDDGKIGVIDPYIENEH